MGNRQRVQSRTIMITQVRAVVAENRREWTDSEDIRTIESIGTRGCSHVKGENKGLF